MSNVTSTTSGGSISIPASNILTTAGVGITTGGTNTYTTSGYFTMPSQESYYFDKHTGSTIIGDEAIENYFRGKFFKQQLDAIIAG